MTTINDEVIYNRLINSPNDFYGLIAYVIYKDDKKKWVKKYQEEFGKTPTEQDLEQFYNQVNILDYQEKSKKKGHAILMKNTDVIFEAVRIKSMADFDEKLKKTLDDYPIDKIKEVVQNYKPDDDNENMTEFLDKYHEKNKIKTLRSNWFSSLLGSIGFAALPFLLLLLSYIAAPTFTKRFLKSFKTEVRDSVVNNGQNTSPVSVTDENTAPYIPVDTTQSGTHNGKQPTK